MPQKRVTVRVEHLQKTFYERLLYAWRQQIEDKNYKSLVYKAYVNLKSCPLEVRTVSDLKRVHGIGETLAVRCHLAWEIACASLSVLDLKVIKKLTNEDFIRFIDLAKNKDPSWERSNTATCLKNNKRSGRIYTDKDRDATEKRKALSPTDAPNRLNDVLIEQSRKVLAGPEIPLLSSCCQNTTDESCFCVCQPSEKPEVILIMDCREKSGSMVKEYLLKSNHRVESRALSVGDYLWVLRKVDGTELLLEWIVERKTWNDLRHSIRSGRYEEQKQRLRRSPMKNRVYLIEGMPSTQLVACNQALATTLVMDGFLIQRCRKPQDSANFLCRLTQYLEAMVRNRQVTGMKFEYFQEHFKKIHVDTVKDIWIRQLMVCPGMSSDRAQIVAQRFPSFLSLMRFYSQYGMPEAETALSSVVSEINPALSTQICKFFSFVLQR